MAEITQDRLKELVIYDKTTGIFSSRVNRYKWKIGDVLGWANERGTLAFCIDGKDYLSHRLAWLYTHGVFPTHNIDHINRDPSDNRIENLRDVEQKFNTRNQKVSKYNKSGYPGVYWNEPSKKWRAQIHLDNKCRHIGVFDSKSEAIKARQEAEIANGFTITIDIKLL